MKSQMFCKVAAHHAKVALSLSFKYFQGNFTKICPHDHTYLPKVLLLVPICAWICFLTLIPLRTLYPDLLCKVRTKFLLSHFIVPLLHVHRSQFSLLSNSCISSFCPSWEITVSFTSSTNPVSFSQIYNFATHAKSSCLFCVVGKSKTLGSYRSSADTHQFISRSVSQA